MVGNLTAGLTTARARLAAMNGVISPSQPAISGDVVASARARSASCRSVAPDRRRRKSIASVLGGYESLKVEREAAVRRYATASTVYEAARSEAERKQFYLIRVVEPNRAVKALYPERGKIVGTVFLTLLFAYAIGWLLVQGIKEHQI